MSLGDSGILDSYERITFHFEGDISDSHFMNFYESARFQYAAARFVTKLANFQAHGRFPQKITTRSNAQILLETQAKGSFDISIIAPLLPVVSETFISTPVSALMTYVFERLFSKSEDSDVVAALNTVENVVDTMGRISDNNAAAMNQALSIIQEQSRDLKATHQRYEESLEQRIAELDRERVLSAQRREFSKIDEVRGQKLLAMGAPLVTEMATALRQSADTLDIITQSPAHKSSRIAYINKRIANEIEVSRVDEYITGIRVDIIQYNKENGWGKVRLHDTRQMVPFNVPTDLKGRLMGILFSEMEKNLTFVQAYFIRDRAGDPTRLIVVGVIPDDVLGGL